MPAYTAIIVFGSMNREVIMAFVRFMTSGLGRVLRVVMGLVLIYVGYFVISGTGGTIMAIIGLVPLLAGLSDYCVFARLMGYPFKGSEARKVVAKG